MFSLVISCGLLNSWVLAVVLMNDKLITNCVHFFIVFRNIKVSMKNIFEKYFDGISFTVLKNCFGALHKPLLHVFNLSIVKGTFPDDLKIARVTPVFKGGYEKDLKTIDQYQF